MTSERWEQITEIYTAALELKSEERSIFLDEICAGDGDLRREVESLLKADADAGDFISEPVIKDIAPFFTVENEPSFTGKNLAHYQILSRLGKGGMGEVYLARDSRLHRKIALKILPASLSENENYLNRFQTEAKAAATLNHPNVATIYSVEQGENQPFITMEFVEGSTLDKILAGKKLDLKTFLEWFVPLSDALSHAHEKGVIHRDIKPSNIMITENGVPKILDFGLAQIGRNEQLEDASTLHLTQPGKVLGTPSYMSPEQAEGKAVDARSDIFSFGVVMYEAITGERPFKGETQAAVIGELMSKEPPSIGEINPEMPYLLSRLVERCLNKERRKRFQTMNEVRVILEEIQAAIEAGVSLHSSSIPALSKSETWLPKWIFALSLLLIVAVALGFYYFRSGAPQQPISFENMTLRKLSQTNNVTFVQISPDGRSIVYSTLDEDSTRSLWIRRIEDKNALALVSKEFRQFWGGTAISPDGSQVFYSLSDENARQGTLYRISSLGGAPRKLVENANDVGAISPDGQRILFVRRQGENLQILSANTADGGDERLIHTGNQNELFRDPRFSADGKSIFFSKRKSTGGKTFWSLIEIPSGGGAEKIILDSNGERIGELAVLRDGKGLIINKTDGVSNLQQLFYIALADGRLQRITNDLNSYNGVGVSNDGNTIVAVQNFVAKDIWTGTSAENLRKLTTESNIHSTAVFTTDGRIVYDALDNNRSQIWIMNGDGSRSQQLTPNESFNSDPQISPDGRYIFFTSDRTGENKIWRMNIDGSSPTLFTNIQGPTFSPVISPALETLWFQWIRENKQVLAKISLTGSEISEQLSFGDNLWAISPDGKQIAQVFLDAQTNQNKIRVRPIDAEEPAKILNIPAAYFLKWTPDGKNLLYRSIEPSPEILSLVWIQSPAGGEPKQFLSVKPDRVSNLTFSPDGKQFLIVRSKVTTDAVMLTKIRAE